MADVRVDEETNAERDAQIDKLNQAIEERFEGVTDPDELQDVTRDVLRAVKTHGGVFDRNRARAILAEAEATDRDDYLSTLRQFLVDQVLLSVAPNYEEVEPIAEAIAPAPELLFSPQLEPGDAETNDN